MLHVIDIVRRLQQSQPASDAFPGRVHVEQHRDNFRLRVSVDFSVLLLRAAPAHGDHRGPTCEIDGKFPLKRRAERRAMEIVDQGLEVWPERRVPQREAAGPLQLRVIVVNCVARLRFHKFAHDEMLKRLAG